MRADHGVVRASVGQTQRGLMQRFAGPDAVVARNLLSDTHDQRCPQRRQHVVGRQQCGPAIRSSQWGRRIRPDARPDAFRRRTGRRGSGQQRARGASGRRQSGGAGGGSPPHQAGRRGRRQDQGGKVGQEGLGQSGPAPEPRPGTTPVHRPPPASAGATVSLVPCSGAAASASLDVAERPNAMATRSQPIDSQRPHGAANSRQHPVAGPRAVTGHAVMASATPAATAPDPALMAALLPSAAGPPQGTDQQRPNGSPPSSVVRPPHPARTGSGPVSMVAGGKFRWLRWRRRRSLRRPRR